MVLRIGNLITLLGFANLVLSAPSSVLDKRQSTLISCLQAASVPLITSSDPEYAAEVVPYNLRLPYFPVAAAVPETANHVSSALICAQRFNVKVAARSGGHSYAAFGLGGKDGSLMIDMKKFKSVVLDPTTQIATVGAGTRLGDIAYNLYNQGGRALPHGLCPGVGISGHALHGGYGMTSRMWGVTLDTIVEMEVVLANGKILTVSKTQHPELFWALRGAGSSIGVVTKFKFQTLEAPASGVEYTYTFGAPTTESVISYRVSILETFQEFALNSAPKELAMRMFVFGEYFAVTGVYWGSRADFDTVIAPLIAQWPAQTTGVFQEYPWLEMLVSLANGEALPQPDNYTLHSNFFTKSIVAPEPLTSDALVSFFNYVTSTPPQVEWWAIADLYGGANSNISTFSLDSAAYAIRDSLFTYQLYSVPLGTIAMPNETFVYPTAGIEYMNGMVESITTAQPQTNFKAYPNYADPSLSPRTAHQLYYGSQYQRLLKVKRAIDPKMTLWNPQAIGVDSGW